MVFADNQPPRLSIGFVAEFVWIVNFAAEFFGNYILD
jgi:hypothetical protein